MSIHQRVIHDFDDEDHALQDKSENEVKSNYSCNSIGSRWPGLMMRAVRNVCIPPLQSAPIVVRGRFDEGGEGCSPDVGSREESSSSSKSQSNFRDQPLKPRSRDPKISHGLSQSGLSVLGMNDFLGVGRGGTISSLYN